jgi:spermidine synthase
MTDPQEAPVSSTVLARLPRLAVPFAGLFVLSGACGLVYEVVWSRLLVQVFGVTAFAVSTVLVSYMGGLAAGAALLGRRADAARRPLRMFAMLEAGVGAYALALPWLMSGVDALQEAAFGAMPDSFLLRSVLRFVFCLALLIFPTALMGGTLPALGRGLLQRRDQVGLGVGVLYFVNTLGAALGCFFAGFLLIPGLGLRGTTLLAASFNGVVALSAFLLDRSSAAHEALGRQTTSAEPADEPLVPQTSPASWPLWVAFGSGAAALAFEVVWFRVLVLVFGSTVYSFSAMLSVFLLGLAIGAAWSGSAIDRSKAPVRVLALTQGAVALFALLGYLAVNGMPAWFLRTITSFGFDFAGMTKTKFLLSSVTLVPPALAFGATFPVAVRLAVASGRGFGARIGRVYAWNTVGAIVGSFGTGFLLLPVIGSEASLKLVVVVSLALAFGSLLAERGPLRLRWALPAGCVIVLVAAGLVLAPEWDRRRLGSGAYFEPRRYVSPEGRLDLDRAVAGYRMTTFTEGYNETIISFRSPKGKFITVNGSTTASDQFEDMFSQRMLGHLPAALHPGPVRSACVVGLGAGVTTGAIAVHDVGHLTAIELEKGVFAASQFFEKENHGVLTNPVVAIRIDDGRNFLKLTRDRFDVISSAPNFPSLTGSGALYTVEYFELCKSRLAPGGVMCQFAPMWRLLPEDLRSIVGSFCDVFPHVRVFSTGLSVVMLGREDPFPPVDFPEIERRVASPPVSKSLAGIGVRGPVELLSFYLFDEAEARRYAEGAPRNTDDFPRIEFHAPRGLFSDTVAANLADLRKVSPTLEARAERLGLSGDYASSFIALAAAYEATNDARMFLADGKPIQALEAAVPAAESGHRYARYVVAEQFERTGLRLQREDRLAAAREQFALALRYEPERLESLVGEGAAALFLGRLEEADRDLSRAVELYPEAVGALYRLGLVREAQGKTDEAEKLYRRAAELEPIQPAPHALLGRRLLDRGEAGAALDELNRAVALGEASEGALLGRVDALLALRRPREALDAARDAVQFFPASADVYEALARAAEAAGSTAEAASARMRREELLRPRPAPPGR